MKHKVLKQVQAVVFFKNKVVLLKKRDVRFEDGKPVLLKKAFWRLPKGKLEKRETHLQGLKRELREEIGVSKTSKPKKVYSYSFEAPKGTRRNVQTFVLEGGEKPRLTRAARGEGITRLMLATVEEAVKKLKWANEKKALTSANAFLRQNL